MHGEYTMVTPSGETFDARIAPVYTRGSAFAELDASRPIGTEARGTTWHY